MGKTQWHINFIGAQLRSVVRSLPVNSNYAIICRNCYCSYILKTCKLIYMKTTGIIAEFNPFHNGHAHLIEKARQNGADKVVVVMSGPFVQRGEPALCDAHIRAEMALLGGADLVLELPVRFATASAEQFAFGGVSILDSLGVTDSIIFGSESGDIKRLEPIADLLCSETAEYRSFLKSGLSEGLSFPAAREQAVSKLLNIPGAELHEIMSGSNNILALEYLKSLKALDSRVVPKAVQRLGEGYHGESADHSDDVSDSPDGISFISAESIRRDLVLTNDNTDERGHLWIGAVPQCLHDFIYKTGCFNTPVTASDFSQILHYLLLSLRFEEIANIDGITPDMADRILNCRNDFKGFTETGMKLTAKNIPYSSICRAFLRLILGLKRIPASGSGIQVSSNHYLRPEYARILGFRASATDLFHEIRKKSKIPLISKAGDAKKLLSGQTAVFFAEDIRASDIYESVLSQKTGTRFRQELTKQVIRI